MRFIAQPSAALLGAFFHPVHMSEAELGTKILVLRKDVTKSPLSANLIN